tara:strand:- start:382 stop:537 length:156 start_codon:yes stop_codon:yes gene_type:complete
MLCIMNCSLVVLVDYCRIFSRLNSEPGNSEMRFVLACRRLGSEQLGLSSKS